MNKAVVMELSSLWYGIPSLYQSWKVGARGVARNVLMSRFLSHMVFFTQAFWRSSRKV